MELYERIPNNVNLSEDKRLQRALEKWLPSYLDWWREMGPDGFQEKDVWLRTAVPIIPSVVNNRKRPSCVIRENTISEFSTVRNQFTAAE